MKINNNVIYTYFNNREESFYSNLEAFKAGWECCLQELKRQDAIKNDRKKGKFVITDFLDDSSWRHLHYSFHGIYHDNGKQVIANPKYALIHYENYSKDLEGKLIDRNNGIIDGDFPNWRKIIPKDENLSKCTDFTKDDVRIICGQFTTKSFKKQRDIFVKITTDNFQTIMSVYTLKRIENFLKVYPDATIFKSKSSTWEIKDHKTGDFFVYVVDEFQKYQYEYSVKDKILIKNYEV